MYSTSTSINFCTRTITHLKPQNLYEYCTYLFLPYLHIKTFVLNAKHLKTEILFLILNIQYYLSIYFLIITVHTRNSIVSSVHYYIRSIL